MPAHRIAASTAPSNTLAATIALGLAVCRRRLHRCFAQHVPHKQALYVLLYIQLPIALPVSCVGKLWWVRRQLKQRHSVCFLPAGFNCCISGSRLPLPARRCSFALAATAWLRLGPCSTAQQAQQQQHLQAAPEQVHSIHKVGVAAAAAQPELHAAGGQEGWWAALRAGMG